MAKKMTTKYKSNKQEKEVAEELEGCVTIASGSLSFQKADVRDSEFLVECKTTKKDFYKLTEDTWIKISKQALFDGMRVPLMCIDLDDEGRKIRLVVINYLDFICLDFDTKAQYIRREQPTLIGGKSYNITSEFLLGDIPKEFTNNHFPCFRQDIKFVKPKIHLVILEWGDFLELRRRP